MSVWSDVTGEIVDATFDYTVTYTLAAGTARQIPGVFDNEYRQFEVGRVPVESNQPVLSVKTSDLPATAARGDTVTVDDVDYTVRSLQPDGHGLTVIVLTEA